MPKPKAPFPYRILGEWSEEDGAFVARVPALPGLAAHGKTPEKATREGHADEETMATIHRGAFEEGLEKTVLAKKFGDLVFPQTNADRKEKLRASIAAAARRLSSLIAEDGAPVPKALAIRIEETIGELLEKIEN